MERLNYTENKSLQQELKEIFSDIFSTEYFEKVTGQICLSDDNDIKREFDIYLPVYKGITHCYIPYNVVYVCGDDIWIEADYIEVEFLIGDKRTNALSRAIDDLTEEELDFLSKEWDVDVDKLFWDVDNGGIENDYKSIREMADEEESKETFNKDNPSERYKIACAMMEKFNRYLAEYYCGEYKY